MRRRSGYFAPVGAGSRRHLVTLENPAPRVSNGRGGFTPTWTALSVSPIWVQIRPVHAAEQEHSNRVSATRTHVVTGPYVAEVTTKTRLTYQGRVFQVTGVKNVDERDVEMELDCVEGAD